MILILKDWKHNYSNDSAARLTKVDINGKVYIVESCERTACFTPEDKDGVRRFDVSVCDANNTNHLYLREVYYTSEEAQMAHESLLETFEDYVKTIN